MFVPRETFYFSLLHYYFITIKYFYHYYIYYKNTLLKMTSIQPF